MKSIDSIHLYRLKHPLRVPYKLAFGPVHYFDTLVAQVKDSEGAIGIGEATILTGYTEETIEGSWSLLKELSKKILQQDRNSNESLLNGYINKHPFTVTALATALEMLYKPEMYQRTQAKNIPILGVINSEQSDALEIEIDQLLLSGFTTLKVKVGFNVDRDSHKVKKIQGFLNNRAKIRIDGNQGYTRVEAMQFIERLDPAGIELVEQPCHSGDWDSALAIAQMSHVPMMLDESIYDLEDIRRAALIQAATFIKVKLMKFGTLSNLINALSLIKELGMKPVLGNGVAGEIGCWMEAIAASTHIENAGEMNGFLKPISSILHNPLKFSDGSIRLEEHYQPNVNLDLLASITTEHVQLY